MHRHRFIVIIMAIILIPTIILSTAPLLRYKEAVPIEIEDGNVGIEEYVGNNVRLLCRPAQSCGVWFITIAVEEGQNTYKAFSDLSRGWDLYVSGDDPFNCLSSELTIYSRNLFILEGKLIYDESNEWGPGYSLSIQKWDIVYPIEEAFRLPFFRRHIYYFDLKRQK